jgi:hypothetical protein
MGQSKRRNSELGKPLFSLHQDQGDAIKEKRSTVKRKEAELHLKCAPSSSSAVSKMSVEVGIQ